jgi:hypothetical protein
MESQDCSSIYPVRLRFPLAISTSPAKGERDTLSISRCSTAHHRDVRAVLRANRTCSTARNPIPCASSSTNAPAVSAPWRPWRSSVLASSSGGNAYSATPEDCALSLASLPPAENATASCLVSCVSRSAPSPARIFQRHQSQITTDLLATLDPLRSPDDQHGRQRGQRFAKTLSSWRVGWENSFLPPIPGSVALQRCAPLCWLVSIATIL